MKNNQPQQYIPAGWYETKLSAVGSFSKGAGISKNQLSTSGHNAIRYGELYTKHHFRVRKIHSFIPDSVAKQATKIKYGDIIFACSGETIDEIGKSAAYLLKEDAYVGGDTIILSPKKADSLFLAYLLNAREGRKKLRELGQGQSVVHIYKSDIENLKLHLPPLPEQNRIVAALETWDQAIRQLSQEIENKKNIKKGLMQELLTGNTRLPGFAEKWEKKTLDQLYDITSSKRVFESEWTNEGVPFYRAREVAKLSANGFVENKLFISKAMYSSYKQKYGVPGVNDLLVTGVGTIGKVFRVKDEKKFYFKDGNIIWLKSKNKVSSSFIEQLFKTRFIQKQVQGASPITTVATYTIDAAKKTIVHLPVAAEQEAITGILETADSEIQTLECKLKLLQEQKRYLLNNLITGAIRVPETLKINS